MQTISGWLEWVTTHRALCSLLVVALAGTLHEIGIGAVRRSTGILSADHRRWISNIHHSSVTLAVVALLALWLPQLQEFALSITAIAVALVIATKELTLCLLGTVLVRSSRAFAIGDWIDVQGRFGEVIERNLLSTQVQEIERHRFTCTGRTVVIPNSVFLGASVVNQNFLRRYQFHRFHVTLEPDAFPIDAEAKLEARIRTLTAPFAETAQRYNAMLEKRTGIDIPDAEPSIELSTNESGHIVTTITVFCPTEGIVELEQAMMREFFDWQRGGRRHDDPDNAEHWRLRRAG